MKSFLWKIASNFRVGCGVILCLHRVRPDNNLSPLDICRDLEIARSDLDDLLSLLRAKGYRIVSIDTLVNEMCGHGSRKPLVAITLDDGYLDNLTEGLAVFEKHDAPFTVYAVPAFLDGALPWWVLLENLVLHRELLQVSDLSLDLSLRSESEKKRAHNLLYREARKKGDAIEHWIKELCDANPGSDSQLPTFMNWKELVELAEHPLATIGNHTLSHMRLSEASHEEVRRQLLLGRQRLEEGLKRKVEHLAYPNGSEHDVPSGIGAIAKETGHRTAVTTIPRNLRHGDTNFALELPRKGIPGVPMEDSRLLAYLGGWEERWNRKVRARLASIRQPL